MCTLRSAISPRLALLPFTAACWTAVWLTCPEPQADSAMAAPAASAMAVATRRVGLRIAVTICPPRRQVRTPLGRVVDKVPRAGRRVAHNGCLRGLSVRYAGVLQTS